MIRQTMMGVAALVALLASAGQPAPLRAQSSPAEPAALLLTHAWLLDGTGAPAVADAWVRIEGDRIAAVGQGTPAPASGAREIDLKGRTILPGLADMHVHLGPLPRAKWALKLLLAHGVTTIKETGNTLGDLEAIARWRATDASLPRVHVSGATLNGSFPQRRFLAAGWQTRALLEDNLRYGAEFLKIHNWISSAALAQIAGFARQHNLYLTGHVPLGMSSVGAIDAGMTILEHVRLHAYEVMDDTHEVARTPVDLNMMDRTLFWAHLDVRARRAAATLAAWEARRERFFVTPTLVMQEATAKAYQAPYRSNDDLRSVSPALLAQWHRNPTSWGDLDASEVEEGLRSAVGMARFIGAAQARGVRVLAGSDFGMAWVVPGVSLHRELELLVEGGMTPVEAVRAATGRAAEALRKPDRGTLRAGQLADLIVAEGNVAANVSAVRRIEHVVLGGRLLDRAALLADAARFAAADGVPTGRTAGGGR